ncbi:hypothetical protein [Tahibacter harae]|uniref:SGNH/GDSL hydrolase family protein n=1 Tax=Tahibacter harae TaxID=2963937 RepID=A0ABT1QVP0_9GAMM|nr:hypothetical protein [Tahibacter harae]MCQ4166350.1 hypothetical protein [Tahibacter harae]
MSVRARTRPAAAVRLRARVRGISAALFAAVLAACAHGAPRPAHAACGQVLFAGNSVIYTNNLPAIFVELAAAQDGGGACRADLIARGGATLSELEEDIARQLASGTYSALVLQEKGGSDLCVLDTQERASAACQRLIASHVRLAEAARAHNVRVLYLGTYQFVPEASQALVNAERELAYRMGARHIPLSERLRAARGQQPALPWLHADGSHPGLAASVLMAALVHKELAGSLPPSAALCSRIALYAPEWTPFPVTPHQVLTAPAAGRRCLLSDEQMRAVFDAAATAGTAPEPLQ